jgi:beta-lactam-binding protein with PASTA domain
VNKRFLTLVFINLAIAIGIFFVLLIMVSWGLKSYTRHGQQISVPDLRGMTLEKAQETLEALRLTFVVMDSAYNVEKPLQSILEQNPKPGAKVKENRKIYLVVNASKVPSVEVPDLAGKSSLKYARLQLQSVGLIPGNNIYRPDPHLNAVIGLEVAGKPVGKGSKVPKGTVVDIILGDGIGGEEIKVPYLLGLTLQEAIFTLQGRGLKIGAVVMKSGTADSLSALVYKQVPEYHPQRTIRIGESIDLFVADKLPEGLIIDPTLYHETDFAGEP